MKASEWSKREFSASSMPQNRTIKSWILKGKVLGRVIDGRIYVYEDQRFGITSSVNSAVSSLIAASR